MLKTGYRLQTNQVLSKVPIEMPLLSLFTDINIVRHYLIMCDFGDTIADSPIFFTKMFTIIKKKCSSATNNLSVVFKKAYQQMMYHSQSWHQW